MSQDQHAAPSLPEADRSAERIAAPQVSRVSAGSRPDDESLPAGAAHSNERERIIVYVADRPYLCDVVRHSEPRTMSLFCRACDGVEGAAHEGPHDTPSSERELERQDRLAYDVMADAVCEIADEASKAFIRAGIEPGEWDGDNIVADVKRGLVGAIERLAARSATGAWKEWGGGERPVDGETWVSVRFRNGDVVESRRARSWVWIHHEHGAPGWGHDIVAYRLDSRSDSK